MNYQRRSSGCTPPPLRLLNFILALIMGNSSQNHSGLIEGINKFKKPNEQETQAKILSLAKESNGRLTIADVTMHTALNLTESKKTLEKMCSDGVAEVQITNGGSLLYAFTGLISNEEKETAKDPLSL